MRRIKLYGELGRKFGKFWKLDVRTPAEACRAIEANRPGFLQHLMDSGEAGIGYRIMLNGRDIEPEELHGPFGGELFKIVPVMAGAGNNGTAKIVIGVLIAAAAIFFAPAAIAAIGAGSGAAFGAAMAGTAFMGISYGSIAMFGVAMALGGISQMLTSTPDLAVGDTGENRASYGFSGAVNTVAQGGPVPIGYGRLMVGSYVISAGIHADDIPVGVVYA